MSRLTLRFAGTAVAAALLIVAVGMGLGGADAGTAAALGAGVGWLAQIAMFWLLADRLFPGRLVPVYALGMLGRFALLGFAAFVLVPAAGVPAAPMLLALAAVLFVTTLMEPLFLAGWDGSRLPRTKPRTES